MTSYNIDMPFNLDYQRNILEQEQLLKLKLENQDVRMAAAKAKGKRGSLFCQVI